MNGSDKLAGAAQGAGGLGLTDRLGPVVGCPAEGQQAGEDSRKVRRLLLAPADELFGKLRLNIVMPPAGVRVGWPNPTTLTGQRGFVVQPRRWVVERTFAWLTAHRRLAKDYEVYAETSETFIYLAMIQFMLQRLAPDPTKRPWNVPIAG